MKTLRSSKRIETFDNTSYLCSNRGSLPSITELNPIRKRNNRQFKAEQPVPNYRRLFVIFNYITYHHKY